MIRIMNFLFLSCHKSTELIEKKIERKLSFFEEIRLKMHLSMCKACSSFRKQSKFINSSIHELHLQRSKRIKKELEDKILKNLNKK